MARVTLPVTPQAMLQVFGLRRLAPWFLIGLTASLLELGLLKAIYEGLGWPLPLATALAAEALILAKFVVADRCVFGHRRPAIDRLLRYHGACAGAFVTYWIVINGLVALLGIWYPLGFLAGTAAALVWSLITNFLWVWAP